MTVVAVLDQLEDEETDEQSYWMAMNEWVTGRLREVLGGWAGGQGNV